MTVSTGSEKRRVLIIVENLPVPFDRRVWSEATTLQEAGYDVTVICPTGKDAEALESELEGIRIFRHPLPFEAVGAMGYLREYSSALYHEFKLSWRAFRQGGFDVIHACNPPDTIFLIGAFYKIFCGKKFVFDHHDINPELYVAKFNRKDLFYRLLILFERLTFLTADYSIATNESYRQIAIERGKMKPERVAVVRSGPNLKRVRKLDPQPSLKGDRPYMVGYVGVIGQQEGIDLLIETVDYLVNTQGRTDIGFVVLGDGPDREPMQKLSEEKGLAEYIDFRGRVSDEELLAYLNTADVCVNPDRVNEMNDKSTMNKIMEYMALEKPIVQFELTEGRVSAQASSLYAKPNDPVDFGDKILDLLADDERRHEMGKMGRQRVLDELSWTSSAKVLLEFYDNVFARKAA